MENYMTEEQIILSLISFFDYSEEDAREKVASFIQSYPYKAQTFTFNDAILMAIFD